MNLRNYFESKNGVGVISTANENGNVNSAIYAKPHFLDDNTLCFIMRDKKTHANLQQNPSANFLFIEETEGYHGIRLNLIKKEETRGQNIIETLARRANTNKNEKRYLVSFKVQKAIELIGNNEAKLH